MRYVFLVTYGRSGSTLLQAVLNTLPHYCIRGENEGVLQSLYIAAAQARETRSRYGDDSDNSDHPWFGAGLVEPGKFSERLHCVFVDEILKPPSSALVIGMKEIRWFMLEHQWLAYISLDGMLDWMRVLFDPCKIVFNVRDVDAVIKSWAGVQEAKWVRDMVTGEDARYAAYQVEHPDACITMNYDEYATDPQALERLFDFLREPFSLPIIQRVLEKPLTHWKNGPDQVST